MDPAFAAPIFLICVGSVIAMLGIIGYCMRWFNIWRYTYKIKPPPGYVIEYNGFDYRYRIGTSNDTGAKWDIKAYAVMEAVEHYEELKRKARATRWDVV